MNFSCRSLRIHAASEWDCTAASIRATAAVAAQLHFLLPCSENSTTALAEAMPAVSTNPCKKKCNLHTFAHISREVTAHNLCQTREKPQTEQKWAKIEQTNSMCSKSKQNHYSCLDREKNEKNKNMSGWALLRSTGGKHWTFRIQSGESKLMQRNGARNLHNTSPSNSNPEFRTHCGHWRRTQSLSHFRP